MTPIGWALVAAGIYLVFTAWVAYTRAGSNRRTLPERMATKGASVEEQEKAMRRRKGDRK